MGPKNQTIQESCDFLLWEGCCIFAEILRLQFPIFQKAMPHEHERIFFEDFRIRIEDNGVGNV